MISPRYDMMIFSYFRSAIHEADSSISALNDVYLKRLLQISTL